MSVSAGWSALAAKYPPPVASLAGTTRDWLRKTFPQLSEEVDPSANVVGYGVAPGYKGLVCTIILSKGGVKLGIANSASFEDPARLLEGSGKKHRYVQLRDATSLLNPALRPLVQRALEFASDE